MAVVTEAKTIRVNMRLNNGYDAQGNISTLGVSLGTLNKDAFDAQKAMNIVNLAGECLDKSVYSVEKTEVTTLIED